MILCHMKSIVVASILVYEVAVTSVYEITITYLDVQRVKWSYW